MAHKKKDLQDSIKEMKSYLSDKDIPEEDKQHIRPNLKKAEKLLEELEAKETQPTAAQIAKEVSIGKKAGSKNPPLEGREAPLTKKQKKSLKQIVADSEKYAAYRGKSEEQLRKDAARSAEKPGKRTSASGKTYYERRANRSDVTAGAPHLAKGGIVNLSLIGIKVNTVEAHEGKFNYSVYRYGNNEYVTSVSKTGWPESFNNKIFKDKKSAVLFSERQARNYAGGGTIGEGKNGYIAFYKGKQVEVMADSSYAAQKKAAEHFKAKKSYDVTVVLAELEGKQVTHAPMFAAGGPINSDLIKKHSIYHADSEKDAHAYARKVAMGSVMGYTGDTAIVEDNSGNWHVLPKAKYDEIKGGTSSNQITVYGYTTTTFTPAAKAAFEKAIEELEAEPDKESTYYKIAKQNMIVLAQNVNTLLKPHMHDAVFVHEFLQSIGITNYKTGLLLDTSFLNKELAVRKLKGGGRTSAVVTGAVNAASGPAQVHYQPHVPGMKEHGGEIEDDEYEEDTFEEQEIDQPDYENDSFITDKTRGGYDVSMAGKFKGHFSEMNEALAFVKKEDERSNYYASLWFVNDHGNVTLIGYDGNEIKMAQGGRTTRGLSRDRKFISQQPHEQRYNRKTPGKTYEKHMAGGGTIENQYAGKTDKEIWNEWTFAQRIHFLNDHNKQLPVSSRFKNIESIANKDFTQIGIAPKSWLSQHVKEGSYAKGGRTTRGLSRDRKFISLQPHEQAYKSKRVTKGKKYKKHMTAADIVRKLHKKKK